MRPFFAYLGILLGACVLFFFYTQCRTLYRLRFVAKETLGRIVGGTIEERYTSGGMHTTGGYSYRPVVIYEYQVDGVSYRGTRYDLSQTEKSRDWAEGVLKRYPAGIIVPVFYNPENPQGSVLTKWLPWQYYLIFFAGSLVLGAATLGGSIVALKRTGERYHGNRTNNDS